ncbi:hypothetical protein [Bradyrhizobium liaoningense]|uniref:hypothetical protein n=1 Tax=Bradyrhizobium liaoningense TaxID=43992 RepID=UPI003D6725E4
MSCQASLQHSPAAPELRAARQSGRDRRRATRSDRSDDDAVYDPFCGSGTVLLEGLLAGRRVFGADSNPIARILSSAKTTALSAHRLEEAYEKVMQGIPRRGEGLPAGPLDLEQWFSPTVLRGLESYG